MKPENHTELQAYAGNLILEHARDIEYLTIFEAADAPDNLGRELTDDEGMYVHRLTQEATITVTFQDGGADRGLVVD